VDEAGDDEQEGRQLWRLVLGGDRPWRDDRVLHRLLGVDLTVFDIGSIDGEFYVKFTLQNKDDDYKLMGFVCSLYMVLHNKNTRRNFLIEMTHICSKESLPYIGGDFNIMCSPEDK
jgi:hypothetical protein